jgi:hypothetical protein
MVIPCAFYGFTHRTTKVTLEVDQEQLQVGQAVDYAGSNYVILSVFESGGHYGANVGLASLHRASPSSRSRPLPPYLSESGGESSLNSHGDARNAALPTRLKTAETTLQDLLRERDEVLERLDKAIQQLDRLLEARS